MKQSYLSPAKVNLFLRITGRRDDGFHELYSLIQTISLYDTLTFESASRDFFSCSDPTLPMDGRNLVVKALQLFRAKTGWNVPLHIDLKKNIPSEAGLGGGSSNAATTLFALNQFAGSPLQENQLRLLASSLGSDVSLFFSSGTALMRGVGEIIEDRRDLFPRGSAISIYKPPFGLSTPLVYQKFREVGKIVPQSNLGAVEDNLYMNDLEHPAFLIRPELHQLKEDLEASGYNQVVMSGSGSAFFCLGEGHPTSFEGFRMIFLQPIERPSQSEWYL